MGTSRSLLKNTGEGGGASYLQRHLTPSPVCGHSLYWILYTQRECRLKIPLSISDSSPDLPQPRAKREVKKNKQKAVEAAKLLESLLAGSPCGPRTKEWSTSIVPTPFSSASFTPISLHIFLLLCLLVSSSLPVSCVESLSLQLQKRTDSFTLYQTCMLE